MSEYSALKATINANVKANNNQEITGTIMNSILNAMVNALGAGYQFIGVATPTNPGTAQTPDYKCFYLATTPGTYTYLGGLVVADGEVALLKWDTSWTKEVTGIASADKLNQLGQKLQPTTILRGVLNTYYMETRKTYHITNTGSVMGSIGYMIDASSPYVTMAANVPVGNSVEYTAQVDSSIIATSNINGLQFSIYCVDDVYGTLLDLIAKTNEIPEIKFNVFGLQVPQRSPQLALTLRVGHNYHITNTGSVAGSVYYRTTKDGEDIRIVELLAGQSYVYTPEVESYYLTFSQATGFSVEIWEEGSVYQKLSAVIAESAVNTKDIADLNFNLFGLTIPKGVTIKRPIYAGHKYIIKNTGTELGSLGYYVDDPQGEYVRIKMLAVDETYEFEATEDAEYLNTSNITGFSVFIYEDGSIYQKLLFESAGSSLIIRACSYNLGDFSGTGLVTPSDEGSLAYRKLLGNLNANIIGTQEDVLYYGGDSGMTEGESVRDTIFGMYKNYYREGTGHYNYKAFASDFTISDVRRIEYTGGDAFAHPWFLRGILNGNILVVSFHFDWQDITRRRKQIAQVISYCADYDKVILMGDTNPSNYSGGEPVDPTIHVVYEEDWALFADAGYIMANNGLFGLFNTCKDGNNWYPYDNIFVKGGTIRNVEMVTAEYMNDHKPIIATIVF